jgi:hypothetical protein
MTTKKAALLSVTIMAVGCVAAVYLWIRRANPVLLALSNDVRDSRGSQLLNPFRVRAPERQADQFLKRACRG